MRLVGSHRERETAHIRHRNTWLTRLGLTCLQIMAYLAQGLICESSAALLQAFVFQYVVRDFKLLYPKNTCQEFRHVRPTHHAALSNQSSSTARPGPPEYPVAHAFHTPGVFHEAQP